MGRTPSCSKEGLNRGAWTEAEDRILKDYVIAHGEGKWSTIPKKAGLNRCGKSCRLRWLNYLRPDIKRGNISEDEEELIIRMHKLLGNRWSLIAGRLPGRTDNEIKNYWNTIAAKKVKGRRPASTPASSKRSKPRPSTDQQPKTDAQPRNTIEHLEPDNDDEKLDVQPGIAAGTPSAVGKDPGPGDFELDDRFLSSFLDLDRDIKEEDNGCGGLGAPVDDGKVTSRASSSLNSEEEALMMSPELVLCESDLQCIASFLQEGESELLQ